VKHKLIKGFLHASNADAAETSSIRKQFYRDMSQHRLSYLVLRWGGLWHEEGLEINRTTPVVRADEDGVAFIKALNEVFKLPAAKALNFNGEIRITVETDTDPIIYRIHVEDGKISYQKASYLWDELVPVTE
jgi:hypothetical protein